MLPEPSESGPRIIEVAPDVHISVYRELATLRTACQAIFDELDDRYDGAPDSPTLWMGEHRDRLAAALKGTT